MIPENYALERIPAASLTGFVGNPRTHSDTQIEQIVDFHLELTRDFHREVTRPDDVL
jgi:hypothetical protein